MKFKTLLEAIFYHAENTPDRVCLIDADSERSLTYKEFRNAIIFFARHVKSCGLQKGDRVVVRVGPLLETLVAQYGINLAGGVFCPVEKLMKPLKQIEMLNYYDSSFLISTERISFDGTWIDLKSALESSKEDIPVGEFIFPNPEDMCAIIFTTGTTGKAKGVMISFKAYAISSESRRDAYGITKDDVYYWVTPIDRASGSRHFGVALVAGCTALHFDGVIFVNNLLQNIDKYGVTAMHLQSFALNIILKASPNAFDKYQDRIRVMFFGGGNLSEKRKEQMRVALPNTRLFTHYNATEVSAISYYEFSRYPGKANCVGKPFPCTKVCLVDDAGEMLPETSKDNFGIVAHEGECGMIGYWQDADLTAKTIINGRIVLTDIGYIGDDRYLYIVGRRDDVIVSGGYKIAPYEIENAAMQMIGIAECACVPSPNDIMGAVPKLFVVMEENAVFSAKEISDFLSARLETFKLPRIIREIETFPRVAGGQKIDRKELINYD